MLPENYAVLVAGDPGSGMFEFCCYLCSTSLKAGEKVVFVEVDSSPDQVHRQLGLFGVYSFDFQTSNSLFLVDCYTARGASSPDDKALRPEDPGQLSDIFDAITLAIERSGGGPVKILFDSLTPLYEDHDSRAVNRFFKDLSTMARFSGTMTALVHKHMLDEDQIADLVNLSDGLVEMKVDDDFRRYVRINHLRGMTVAPRWVPFEFEVVPEDEGSGTFLEWKRD